MLHSIILSYIMVYRLFNITFFNIQHNSHFLTSNDMLYYTFSPLCHMVNISYYVEFYSIIWEVYYMIHLFSVYIYIYINILLMEYVWDPVDNGIFTNKCRICPSTILLLNHAKYPYRYSILLLLDGIIFLTNCQCFSSNKAHSTGRPFAAIVGSKDFTEILRKEQHDIVVVFNSCLFPAVFY